MIDDDEPDYEECVLGYGHAGPCSRTQPESCARGDHTLNHREMCATRSGAPCDCPERAPLLRAAMRYAGARGRDGNDYIVPTYGLLTDALLEEARRAEPGAAASTLARPYDQETDSEPARDPSPLRLACDPLEPAWRGDERSCSSQAEHDQHEWWVAPERVVHVCPGLRCAGRWTPYAQWYVPRIRRPYGFEEPRTTSGTYR